jgi:hypothetical protein
MVAAAVYGLLSSKARSWLKVRRILGSVETLAGHSSKRSRRLCGRS